MKISIYVRFHIKTIPWKFGILNPNISRVSYLPVKFGFFAKSRLFYLLVPFVNKHFIYWGAYFPKIKWSYNVKPSVYCCSEFYINLDEIYDVDILLLYLILFVVVNYSVVILLRRLFSFPLIFLVFVAFLDGLQSFVFFYQPDLSLRMFLRCS